MTLLAYIDAILVEFYQPYNNDAMNSTMDANKSKDSKVQDTKGAMCEMCGHDHKGSAVCACACNGTKKA